MTADSMSCKEALKRNQNQTNYERTKNRTKKRFQNIWKITPKSMIKKPAKYIKKQN